MEHAMHELKLNVSQFYQDDEVRHLLTSEEAPPFPGSSEEDFFLSGERYYECIVGSRVCRISRSSVLAMALFCTLAVAVILISVVLLCTVITMTSPNEEVDPADEMVGVINWLHYPVGEVLVKSNHTSN